MVGGKKNAFCLDVTAGLAIYLGRQREARICEDRNGSIPGLCLYDIGPRSSSLFFSILPFVISPLPPPASLPRQLVASEANSH